MMNFMNLVKERVRMEETMSPIKEEVFNEVNQKDLRSKLCKARKVIEPYSDTFEV